MSLQQYNQKRDFHATSEPEGVEGKAHRKPVFVVQKHAASHLHFDFRLEADGVLKSWAVPKGPSMNPADKRLAVEVEDHPLEYASFEGEIAEGNYGAGHVEIWDNGTWEPAEKYGDVVKALEEGVLEFTLKGKILKGAFKLIKTGKTVKNGWLLIKRNDEYAVRETYNAYQVAAE